ncbi:Inositol polyphosphate [Operophtera brumata]|uniref:Inositol polyphosphate n=1 Tax=Operophtera brumata TaxID=104452 RepID=A0A0L7LEQ3_OPEBR|nr:Inositol polyphosphate [Operophtera brumata]
MCLSSGMGGEACACSPTPPRLMPAPEPDLLYDHHSSEEELESRPGVLNLSKSRQTVALEVRDRL